MCVCCLVSLTCVFHTFPTHSHFFFHKNVKVPSHDHKVAPEVALKHFQQEVPALALLGTPYYIDPNTPYTVDKEVQLVCKYLKALQVGGTKGIDRLYQEGKKIEMCVCVCTCGLTHPNVHVQLVLMPTCRSSSALSQT